MFREMRRFKQQISEEECIGILKAQPRGVLSVSGDDGYPYGFPISYWFNEEDGHIYFHCAKQGHKIDSINRSDKVSFCVYDEGFRREGEWALNIKSVIVFGRIKPVDDSSKVRVIAENLCLKFTSDKAYFEKEFADAGSRVLCLELIPEHISGKLVNES